MVQKKIIEFKDISKKFGKHEVLSKINLSIYEGEILGIVGRSGSGKTTLFRIFLDIYNPSSGIILYRNKKKNSIIKEKIGFASQENSFYPTLTVEENLFYFGRIYNLPDKVIKKRVGILMELMELHGSEKSNAKKLSGGMKRRLDLAIALIHDPEILILDEPTTGLDVVLSEEIWNLIIKISSIGKTIIISSHNLTEIGKYCHSVAFLAHKTIVEWKDIKKNKNKYKLEEIFRRICYD